MKVTPTTLAGPDGRRFSLTIGRVYEVLGIEADDYRLLNDESTQPYGNDPVLFESEYFEVLAPEEPSFWQCQYGDEGERYCYPPEWNHPGFFEKYHDHVPEAIDTFWNGVKKYYPDTWKERQG
ncbi:MAG: hypothetical protein PVH19_12275 [Planctomycetia bacterium]|jgi:hypothetical protein